jgi:hypothetical protein
MPRSQVSRSAVANRKESLPWRIISTPVRALTSLFRKSHSEDELGATAFPLLECLPSNSQWNPSTGGDERGPRSGAALRAAGVKCKSGRSEVESKSNHGLCLCL